LNLQIASFENDASRVNLFCTPYLTSDLGRWI
jgi:hypothetical protein